MFVFADTFSFLVVLENIPQRRVQNDSSYSTLHGAVKKPISPRKPSQFSTHWFKEPFQFTSSLPPVLHRTVYITLNCSVINV